MNKKKEPIIEKKKLLCIKNCKFGFGREHKTVFFEGNVYDSTFFKNSPDNNSIITVYSEEYNRNFPFIEWRDSTNQFKESTRYIYDYFEII